MRAITSSARALPRARTTRPGWTPLAYGLSAIVGALTAIGLVFILSASSVESLARHESYWAVFVRQAQWEALGMLVFMLVLRLGYRFIATHWFTLWVGTVLMLVAVKTPLGVTRNGSQRWIGPATFEIQPSEAAKLIIVAALAHVLSIRGRRIDDWRDMAGPSAIVAVPLVGLVFLQPDLGTTAIVAFGALAVLWAAGVPGRWLAILFAVAIVGLAISVKINPYQWDRLTVFLDPSRPEGYHLRRSLSGIASGGWFGLGVGAGRSKWGYLPNAHTDFIYAVIAEEVGLVGALIVLSLFIAFAVTGLQIARRAPDRYGRLLATGLTAYIVFQAVTNIGAVTGVAPVTGVPLPFVSQGGTAFVTLMIAVALLVDIARRGIDPEADARRRRYTERTHPSQRRSDRGGSGPFRPAAVGRTRPSVVGAGASRTPRGAGRGTAGSGTPGSGTAGRSR